MATPKTLLLCALLIAHIAHANEQEVFYDYSLTPRWAFSSRVDYLNADIDDYSGSLVNLGVGINYRVFEKIRVGLCYNRLELDLSITKPDLRGGTETSYKGLYSYASGYW